MGNNPKFQAEARGARPGSAFRSALEYQEVPPRGRKRPPRGIFPIGVLPARFKLLGACQASIEHDEAEPVVEARSHRPAWLDRLSKRTWQTSIVVHASSQMRRAGRQINPCSIMDLKGDGCIGGNQTVSRQKKSIEFKGGAAC